MSQLQPPAERGTGPSPTTLIAAIIVIFLGAIWTVVSATVTVFLSAALFAGRGHYDTFGASIALVFAPFLLVILVVLVTLGLLLVWMGVRILKRGNGARWTAIVVFGLFALSSLGGSGRGANVTGAGRLGTAIFFALVPVLLLLPPSIEDFREAKGRRLAARMMPPPAAGAPPPP